VEVLLALAHRAQNRRFPEMLWKLSIQISQQLQSDNTQQRSLHTLRLFQYLLHCQPRRWNKSSFVRFYF
jgi:hypothetical protein